MQKLYLLVKTSDLGLGRTVAGRVKEIKGVKAVEFVTGPEDIIVTAEVDDSESVKEAAELIKTINLIGGLEVAQTRRVLRT